MSVNAGDITVLLRAGGITVHLVKFNTDGYYVVFLERSLAQTREARAIIKGLPGVTRVDTMRPWMLYVFLH